MPGFSTMARFLLAGAAAAGAAGSAMATESWVIAGGGDKPKRTVLVAHEDSIRDASDLIGFMQTASMEEQAAYQRQLRRKGKLKKGEARAGPDAVFEIRADEVFEDPAKPNRITTRYQINCTRNVIGAKDGNIQWRHKRHEAMPDTPAHRPASFSEVQLLRFVCGRGADGRSREPGKSPPQLGFLFIGDTGLSPVDFVWKVLWEDGKRPPFTYRPSNAELEATERRLTETLSRAQGMAAEVIDGHQRSANRVGRHQVLEMWIGKTEQEFARVWGNPDRFTDGPDGSRSLFYRKGYVNQGKNVYGHVLREDHYWCDVTVLTRGGIVKDYSTSGNSCVQLIK